MLIMLYDTASKSRNADFNNLRPKGATITLSPLGLSPLSEANTTRRRQAATTLGA